MLRLYRIRDKALSDYTSGMNAASIEGYSIEDIAYYTMTTEEDVRRILEEVGLLR